MKYLTILLAFLLSSFPIIAGETLETVRMGDFDRTMEGFSFTKGELVKLDPSVEGFPMEIDFIFDMPSGLGMNNSVLTEWFPGEAEIIDLGQVSLDTEIEIPLEGFNPFLGPDNIILGHTYLIKLADSEHYGKIKIVQFDFENELIEFIWVYLGE